MMQMNQICYLNCPYCCGQMGETQCVQCYERSVREVTLLAGTGVAATFTGAGLTEADVRRIVREELDRHAVKSP